MEIPPTHEKLTKCNLSQTAPMEILFLVNPFRLGLEQWLHANQNPLGKHQKDLIRIWLAQKPKTQQVSRQVFAAFEKLYNNYECFHEWLKERIRLPCNAIYQKERFLLQDFSSHSLDARIINEFKKRDWLSLYQIINDYSYLELRFDEALDEHTGKLFIEYLMEHKCFSYLQIDLSIHPENNC